MFGYLQRPPLFFCIDLLDLRIGSVEDKTIVRTAELQTPIEDVDMVDIGEKPGFVSTILVPALLKDDGNGECTERSCALV